ncbi:tyrosine-type recombinase/integrase [Arcobacter sp.]|uniref:tyrosine-type recombinase/integrase n=1 Tax=Arcobacter sp. TaxID=1872629 RepID=UPI003C789363
MIKTKKVGVYFNPLENGDKAFYFTYKDINDNNKLKWINVGKYSEGIREANAIEKRAEQITIMRHGEDIRAVSKKKHIDIITLNNLAQKYFNDKNIKKYRINKYKLHIKDIFGEKDITQIKKIDIQSFLNNLTQKYENATINGIRELITSIFNHSIKEHELKIANPCNGIKRLKTDNERIRYLNKNEIDELLFMIKDNKPIWLFVKIALSTGARVMSIADIQKKDLDLTTGTVTIKNHKTNSTYTAFLQDDLIEFLNDYIKLMKKNDYVCSINEKMDKPTQKNIQWRLKPILDNLFNKELDKYDSKNRVVIHTLRHTFASHLAINNTPIFTIQKLLDHTKIEQTLRYAKLAPDSGKHNVKDLYQ